ncbi:hypothetical protein [Thermoanaerobacter siderophilus]|uniref:Uncharacterized protein n=1 Tax=Thermoanaerobacter siderophilus SR4 TaxID=880478 RepID=I9AD63_9THEO|nr:hypothetical protein [Thermoanaerobacter siderophilus]EIV99941.1 hypothetical protein ThesiDRAFT1_0959 [Thermoanaerobacter siderophilus SR4]
MIKITLSKKKGMKKKVYEMWEELKLTGHMLIEQKDKNYIITLEPEKEISLSLLKQKLPKESIVEEVNFARGSAADEDVFTELNPEEMDV